MVFFCVSPAESNFGGRAVDVQRMFRACSRVQGDKCCFAVGAAAAGSFPSRLLASNLYGLSPTSLPTTGSMAQQPV